MKTPAIPSVPKPGDPRSRFDGAVKKSLEILLGVGGLKADGLVYADEAGDTFQAPESPAFQLVDAATIVVDASLGGVRHAVFDVTLAGNRTLNLSNGSVAIDGKKIVLRIKQDATGSRTITWGSMVRFGTDVTSPTLTTTAAKMDMIGLIYNHADGKFDVAAVARGY